MKIKIKGEEVTIEDDSGGILVMTTGQLIEIVCILNISIREGGGFLFDCLEFTV